MNSGNGSGDGGNVWDQRETTGCVCLTSGAAGIIPTLLGSQAAFLTAFLLLLPVLPIQFLVITLTCTAAWGHSLNFFGLQFRQL